MRSVPGTLDRRRTPWGRLGGPRSRLPVPVRGSTRCGTSSRRPSQDSLYALYVWHSASARGAVSRSTRTGRTSPLSAVVACDGEGGEAEGTECQTRVVRDIVGHSDIEVTMTINAHTSLLDRRQRFANSGMHSSDARSLRRPRLAARASFRLGGLVG